AHVSQTLNNTRSATTASTQNPASKKAEETTSDDTKAKEVGMHTKGSKCSVSAVQEAVAQHESEELPGSCPDLTEYIAPSIGKRIDSTGSVHDIHAGTPDSDHGDGEDKNGSQNDRENDGTKSVTESIDEAEEFRKIDILVASDQRVCGDNIDNDREKREENSVQEDGDLAPHECAESAGTRKSIQARVKEWKTRRVQYAEDMPRTYEVFQQACYYLGAFYCTHVWSTSNRVVQTISGGETVFPLLACHSFFDPFQGFLNYLVYQRPRFIQLKKKHPELGWWGIMVKSLRFSFMDAGRSGSNRSFGDSRNFRKQSLRKNNTVSGSSRG
ncbi:MAG: hypothetical protein SGBAC_010029, partial [Bacillariaceae sp.]